MGETVGRKGHKTWDCRRERIHSTGETVGARALGQEGRTHSKGETVGTRALGQEGRTHSKGETVGTRALRQGGTQALLD